MVSNNIEELIKSQDPASSMAQRKKLYNDFLTLYNNIIKNDRSESPSKSCFYTKGYEFLDSVSENRYISSAVSISLKKSYFEKLSLQRYIMGHSLIA